MRYADVISGTFGGECLSLAAAGAVLDAYEPVNHHSTQHNPTGPCADQWEFGVRFKEMCGDLKIPVTGYPVHPKITYTGREMAIFLQETARRGLLIHPAGFNVSAALTEDDLRVTFEALKGAKEALDAGVPLEGNVPAESLFKRTT